jgi:hypothetical protein
METPRRFIRVGDHIWDPAYERAGQDGFSISELVRRWLNEYGRGEMPSVPGDVQPIRHTIDELVGLAGQLRAYLDEAASNPDTSSSADRSE